MNSLSARFPQIYRFFTATLFFIGLWAGFGLVLGVNGLTKKTSTKPQNTIQNESILGTSASDSVKLVDQFNYWKTIAEKRPDYRDAFIMSARLALELNHLDEARRLIGHAFELDPTFPAVLEIKKLLEE